MPKDTKHSTPAILINGTAGDRIVCTDRGLQYGDGVFRTALIHQGRLTDASRQLGKLHDDACAIGLKPPAQTLWLEDIEQLVAMGQENAAVKFMLTRGNGSRGYYAASDLQVTRISAAFPFQPPPAANWHQGVSMFICSTRWGKNPQLAGIKHLNRLDQVLARNEFGSEHPEGLMLDLEEHIISGTMSNIFLVRQGRLFTPAITDCGIEGVMRSRVLELAKTQHIDTEIRALTLDDLFESEEVFLTNSLIGIWPVNKVTEHTWAPGRITRCMQKQLDHPTAPTPL